MDAARRVAEIADLQRDRRRLGLRADVVVGAERLADRDQRVGPAGLQQQRRRRAGHARDAVVPVGVVERRLCRPAEPAGVELLLPQRQVGAEVAAGRRHEAGEPDGEDPACVVLGLDAGRGARPRAPPVAGEDRLAVGPQPARPCGGEADRDALRARPRRVGAVGQHDAVLQEGQHGGEPAAVGDPGGADRGGVDHALVDELADERLDVAHLVADVAEAGPPRLASRGPRRRRAAGVAEAACGRRDDRVALLREEPVGVAALGARRALERRLVAAQSVQEQDGGKRTVARGGQGDVDVDGRAVEARRPRREVGGRAEAHAVGSCAVVTEGRGDGL